MGTTYRFECEKCGYRTHAAGGVTEGRDLKVQTVVCKECRDVFDCVIARRMPRTVKPMLPWLKPTHELVPTLQAALARLPSSPRRPRHWHEFSPACPRDPTHRIEPWSAPGRCPRCRAYLERGGTPFRLWD